MHIYARDGVCLYAYIHTYTVKRIRISAHVRTPPIPRPLHTRPRLYIYFYTHTPTRFYLQCKTTETRRGCLLSMGWSLAMGSSGPRERDTGSVGYRCSSVTHKRPS